MCKAVSLTLFLVLSGALSTLDARPKLSLPGGKEMNADEYQRLSDKAEHGDAKAARALAKYCYLHDSDGERAAYWLQLSRRDAGGTVADLQGAIKSRPR